MNHSHEHGTDNSFKYNMLYSTHDRHESPVRDNQPPLHFNKKEVYKDHYDVSNFKFPEVRTKFHSNHANFCELSFDGTKSAKHHRRRSNSIKRVTSATTINWCQKKPETSENEEEHVLEKNIKNTTFKNLAEQFKKFKFIETPVKLHKNIASNQKTSTFEVILSPKTPTSYSSLDTMGNILQTSEKKIIVSTTTKKPNMHDREIQTAMIGIRNVNNMNEYFNMGLASVNEIFYNMDLLPPNADGFNLRQKKLKKQNLTVTNFPCVEIKCSSIFFEMPANAERPRMPRRTINVNNSILEDYQEASTNIEDKLSESITGNSSETNDNLKEKICSFFADSFISSSDDYNKKVNDLCDLINHLLTETKSKYDNDKNIKKSVKIPGEMLINISKVQTATSNEQNALLLPSYPSSKIYCKNNMFQKMSCPSPTKSDHSSTQNRSRSVSPPSRPSTPTCEISKMPIHESNIEIAENEDDENKSKNHCFNANINTSDTMENNKFSFTSVPSVSTISTGSTKMVLDELDSNDKKTPQLEGTVPRNVFFIPPHVNEILKNSEFTNINSNIRKEYDDSHTSRPTTKKINSPKSPEFNLINVLKKPSIKQTWIVPCLESKSQSKCDSINLFQCSKNIKSNKADQHFGGPSVTFSSMVDVFGGDNDKQEKQMFSTRLKTIPNTISPVGNLKKSKTCPNKPDFYTMNENENKTKTSYEKQASFYNSNLLSPKTQTNNTSCLQKRKEYDTKWKMQLQTQQKQISKIPLPTKVVAQDNNAINNKVSKDVKSKLPLKVTNETVNNKQFIYKTNMQDKPKTFTMDTKDTPFSKLKTETTSRKPDSQSSTPRPTNSILKNNSANISKDVTHQEIKKNKSFL